MRLGLAKDEVKIVPHTKEWKTEFNNVHACLVKNTGLEGVRIEHIGSTAIGGIHAKPIIDLMVGVDDLENVKSPVRAGLKACGFLQLRVERPGEVVFARFTDESYKVKTHYVHLMEYKSELWNNLLFFRDYLNEHEDEKRAYENLKFDFINGDEEGIVAYTDHKEAFVKRITDKRPK
ncbi:GrpB family protein [Pontibacillus salipaludis]|uniref:GrpB family protein n=1 Tax=Pontibacillus salipaludis TaxID=1697394 RepID=A0ABQ1QBH8_9BACI|nr:GrpB family protein [Pontibacillus salipaludis]GGD20170.1 hypothetical protein GCM10011389_29770 [Pontibacillus salipaludis]